MSKRRNRAKPQTGVSLFSFLDVLICTLGALIILMLLVVHRTRLNAREFVKEAPAAPVIDEKALREQIEDADWRRQLLEEQRLAKSQELSDQRLELSHLEDHIRRLQDRWKELEAQAAQLHDQDATKDLSHERVAEQMAQVAAQIEQARLDLLAARDAAKRKPRSFSIIPYNGPNGTARRPIYIECTADAVIIQPEGFVLDAGDFTGSLGPGNPLDACLRAVREYLARNPEFSQAGEPYPLLIVRPDGVLSYAAARAAMKSWDDEFGYELVEQETKLAYPALDPTLKLLLERAVADARRRQSLLAAAAPSRFRSGSGGDGTGGGAPHGGFRSIVPTTTYGDDGPGGGGNRSTGVGRGGGQSFNEGYTGSRMQRSTGGHAQGQQTQGGQQRQSGSEIAGSEQAGRPGQPAREGQPRGGNAGGGTQAGAGSVDGTAPMGESVQPIANKKGSNWGLPNYTEKATGITRPIRIRIEADRLLILPERGERRAARVVPIQGSMTGATEELVSQIWDEVDGWGIAVSNGYWKPVLNIEVATGQDTTFQQLETLLDGSGLEVRRRSP